MTDKAGDTEQTAAITDFVDIDAPPPVSEPTAHIIFGTNQIQPVELVAHRHKRGLAPLIIATGGVNRHDGTVEGRQFHRLLLERDVPERAIRVEDQSANTWQNVELAMPWILEALNSGLRLTIVSKWYHRRTVHMLKTLVPDAGTFFAIGWVPNYDGKPVTRTDWPHIPAGKRRVVREWEEVSRRVTEGSLAEAHRTKGGWG